MNPRDDESSYCVRKLSADREEARSWIYALVVMSVVSLVMITLRILGVPAFALEFELCMFYLPTALVGAVCLHFRRSAWPSSTSVAGLTGDSEAHYVCICSIEIVMRNFPSYAEAKLLIQVYAWLVRYSYFKETFSGFML